MSKGKSKLLILVILILGIFAMKCEDDSTSANRSVNNTDFVATESFRHAVEVDHHNRLNLNAVNGIVAITGASVIDSVIISGEKKVGSESLEDAQDYLSFLEIVIEDQTSIVEVNTEQPANTYGRSLIVDYTIQVPDSFYITVRAVNGLISIEAMNKNLNIQNINGQILLDDIAAGAVATLANGQISGDITLPTDGLIRLSATNGDINLSIPDNTSAQFSASVAAGIIQISNLVLRDEESTSNSVTGTLGDGSGEITLSVSNGTINVNGY